MLIGLDSPESVFQVAQLCNAGERRTIRRTTHFGSTSSPILRLGGTTEARKLVCFACCPPGLYCHSLFHPANPLSSFPRKAHSSLPLAKASARELSIQREKPSSRGARTAPAPVFLKTQKTASTAYQLTLPPAPAPAPAPAWTPQ